MLGQGQYDIKTVSVSKDYVQSIGGFRVMPDYDTTSVPKDYETLILIGGMSPALRDYVHKKQHLFGKVVSQL